MRLVSYNILEGGEGRADPLAEVILAQRPDVVALLEANHPAVLERLSSRLGMECIRAPGNDGFDAAILSRWTIRETINHAALSEKLSRSFLEATIIEPSGSEWVIAAVHLHPHLTEPHEQKREEELAIVLDGMAEHRRQGRRHVLCGDFNAIAPNQNIDADGFERLTGRDCGPTGEQLPRRIVRRVLEAGYTDALAAVDPATAETAGTFSTQFPVLRVDYIFGFACRTAAAWIEQDRLAKYASDHYPVAAELE